MKPSGPGLLFVYKQTVSISVLVMDLLRFSIFPGSALESYTFLRICPFLPSCPFYWHIVADSSLLWSFVFLCCPCCDFSIFISNFVDLILLPVFLDESGKWFVYFVYLLKEPDFSFVDFGYGLICFFCIYFCPNFYDFFPSTNPGGCFISSFSSCFRYRVRLFIWFLSCFFK